MARGTFNILDVTPSGPDYVLTVDAVGSLMVGDHVGARTASADGALYLVSVVNPTMLTITVEDSLAEAEDVLFGQPTIGSAGYGTPEARLGLTQLPFNAPGWDAMVRRNSALIDDTSIFIPGTPSTFANPVTNSVVGTTEPGRPEPVATGRTSLAHGQGSYTGPFASSTIAWGRYCSAQYYSSLNLGISQSTDSGNTVIVGLGQNTAQQGQGGEHLMVGVFNYLSSPGYRHLTLGFNNQITENTSTIPRQPSSLGNTLMIGSNNRQFFGGENLMIGNGVRSYGARSTLIMGGGNRVGAGQGAGIYGVNPGDAISTNGGQWNLLAGANCRTFTGSSLTGGFFARNFGNSSMSWGNNCRNYGAGATNVGHENRTYGAYSVALGVYNNVGSIGARQGGATTDFATYNFQRARQNGGGVGIGIANKVRGVQSWSHGSWGEALRDYQRTWTASRNPYTDPTLFQGIPSSSIAGGNLQGFGTKGSAQTSLMPVWSTTADATPSDVGGLDLEEDKSYKLKAEVLARNSDDDVESNVLEGTVLVTRAPTVLTHSGSTTPYQQGERIIGDLTTVLAISHLQTGNFMPSEVVEGPQRVSFDPDTINFEGGPLFNGQLIHFTIEEDYYEADTLLDHNGVTGDFDFDFGGGPPGPSHGAPEGVIGGTSGATGYIRALGQRFGIGSITGTFVAEETIVGGTSGAVGTLYHENGTDMWVVEGSGSFQNGETVTGQINGATAVLGTPPTEFVSINRVTGTFQSGEVITGDESGATVTTSSGPVGGARGFAPHLGDNYLGFLKSTISGTFLTGEWIEADLSQREGLFTPRPPRGTRAQLTSGQLAGAVGTLETIEGSRRTLSLSGFVEADAGNEWYKGQAVEGQTSGAWTRIEKLPELAIAVVKRDNIGTLDVRESVGTFQNGETITGELSGAEAILTLAPTLASAVLNGTTLLSSVAKEGTDATSAQFVVSGTRVYVEGTGVLGEKYQWLNELNFSELMG